MKIDIHVHTRKVKQGDSPLREVTPERFAEVVLSTDVKIVAITNHNLFDLQQYEQILEEVDGAIQVWPGVERSGPQKWDSGISVNPEVF